VPACSLDGQGGGLRPRSSFRCVGCDSPAALATSCNLPQRMAVDACVQSAIATDTRLNRFHNKRRSSAGDMPPTAPIAAVTETNQTTEEPDAKELLLLTPPFQLFRDQNLSPCEPAPGEPNFKKGVVEDLGYFFTNTATACAQARNPLALQQITFWPWHAHRLLPGPLHRHAPTKVQLQTTWAAPTRWST
jgi:hypothetical protein